MILVKRIFAAVTPLVYQRAKPSAGDGSSKPPKKKAKKDKNAPKSAISGFMQFSQAKRAEVSVVATVQ